VEKLKDKTLMKTVQENLYEAQKNYEALNNQLLEELPYLIEKCSTVMQKCFTLYLRALGDIHKRIRFQLFNLLFGQVRKLKLSFARFISSQWQVVQAKRLR
jgi:hypothetical protein